MMIGRWKSPGKVGGFGGEAYLSCRKANQGGKVMSDFFVGIDVTEDTFSAHGIQCDCGVHRHPTHNILSSDNLLVITLTNDLIYSSLALSAIVSDNADQISLSVFTSYKSVSKLSISFSTV